MRILIVNDDAALGGFLQKGLRLEGHDTYLTCEGRQGLRSASESSYDMIVLDLNLSQQDAMLVLEELREQRLDASVLVLTSRNDPSERVRCLDLGADDVLVKPFSFSEFTARCRALTRRSQRFVNPILRQDEIELNRMERKVSLSGRVVDLTVKEFALLEYLMLARGRVCSRSELLREVWQMSPDAGTNVVDVYVNYLRKKLGGTRADAKEEQGRADDLKDFSSSLALIGARTVIDTFRGEGYSLSVGQSRKPVRSERGTSAPRTVLAFALPGGPQPFQPSAFGSASGSLEELARA